MALKITREICVISPDGKIKSKYYAGPFRIKRPTRKQLNRWHADFHPEEEQHIRDLILKMFKD